MTTDSTNSALSIYMRQIEHYPLLTPAEELSVARRVRRGQKNAKDKMIHSNLRLVVKIARDYQNYGLPLMDLISEGNIGLTRAVERFDPDRGSKMSTYASWWIKQSIKRALANQAKTVRLPVHIVEKISRIRQAGNVIAKQMGRDASDEEISRITGLSTSKVSAIREASQTTASLDAKIGLEEDTNLMEIIADESAINPGEHLAQKDVFEKMQSLLSSLDKRERSILNARFGLDGKEPLTLDQVGEKLGYTRERIRQVQNQALKKLRNGLDEPNSPALVA